MVAILDAILDFLSGNNLNYLKWVTKEQELNTSDYFTNYILLLLCCSPFSIILPILAAIVTPSRILKNETKLKQVSCQYIVTKS